MNAKAAGNERGKGKTVYVGGFGNEVNEQVLYSVFTPFGDIVELQIPADTSKGADGSASNHKGFGFIEFAEAADAQSAVDNMCVVLLLSIVLTHDRHLNEINGRTLKVNLSRPIKPQNIGEGKALWATDDYLAVQTADDAIEED